MRKLRKYNEEHYYWMEKIKKISITFVHFHTTILKNILTGNWTITSSFSFILFIFVCQVQIVT